MKKILVFLTILAISGCVTGGTPTPSASAKPSDIPTNGLLAYLSFNDNANDISGNNLKVTVSGDAYPVMDKNSKKNQAYAFDGDDDYIQVDLDINHDKHNKLTIVAWAKSTKEDTEGLSTVISNDDGDFDRTILIDNRGEVKGWSAFAGNCEVFGAAKVEVNKWTFLAAIYDQDNKTIDFFINDKKFSKTGCEIGMSENKFFRIGNNPGFGEYFKGSIDEVRVYNRKLSLEEINTLYKAY